MADRRVTCEIAKGCSPSRSRYCLRTWRPSKNKLQVNILVFIQFFKKLCVGKIHLKIKRGGAYSICGLDIGCAWCVEMNYIYNDFDKHCLLSQKRLIKEIFKWFCIIFLINDIYDLCISDGIKRHSSDSDWTIFPIWFLLVHSIDEE